MPTTVARQTAPHFADKDEPGPHPGPPADLHDRALPIRNFLPGQAWHRIHGRMYDPIFFGCNGGRFDDPEGQYGVLYLGSSPEAAFAETICRTALGGMDVSLGWLSNRTLTVLRFDSPLRLVDLTGDLFNLGADARLWSGAYKTSRSWARAFFTHPDAPDGLLYPSRHAQTRLCAALFNRRALGIGIEAGMSLAEDADWLGRMLDLFHVPVLPDE